jgi:hypothetical protein
MGNTDEPRVMQINQIESWELSFIIIIDLRDIDYKMKHALLLSRH